MDTPGGVQDSLIKTQRLLDEGQFEAAREAIERGYEGDPTDRRIQEMFQQVLFAYGVRQARKGRDLRRDAKRGSGRREQPEDLGSQEAFRSALDSFDRVLLVNPGHVKAVVMKGATLYRMDRKENKGTVKGMYEKALESFPDSQELRYALDLVSRGCENCGDSGNCPTCKGSGQVSAVLFRSTCPACRGAGVCRKCAIL